LENTIDEIDEKEKALKAFREGANCCQSVLSSCSELTGIDPLKSRAVAAAFGGGICHWGQTCGAVNGGLMALGLIYPELSKDEIYELGNKFAANFVTRNGSTQCKGLIGVDFSDAEQYAKAKSDNVFQLRCGKYIGDAVDILKEMIDNK
jgi:C_GCAxxG_C_C family probable redox protein